MSKELPKNYDPQLYEDSIYKKWEKSGFFNPDVCIKEGVCKKNADTYTIVLPPPNITDKLHLGHVVMVATSDVLVRYHRMNGKKVLWIPGTDHAAIATQNVVEKKIWKEDKKTRHDLGKEKFLDEVNKFVKVTQATIINQLKKTGASLDWSREAFTLDEQRQKAVKQMFVDMYNEGVIYQGHRIVNWCPRCQSTLADDEVEHKEQNAKFYTFKYSKDFPFAVSTTRPETKLGDTAVAVNPDDTRYAEYIGKEFKVNFVGTDLTLKVIADKGVDPNFGTGALGVTPAHSMVDYDMAQKHKLEIKKVIDETGKIVEGLSEFSGKTVIEARKMIVEELKKQELLEKEEDIKNNLSVCYRCDATIEPLTSKQWFVAVDKKLKRLKNKSLKEKATEVAKFKEINFVPERFNKRYLDWMESLHDWCISRQIWFGHQIPVWYKGDEVYAGVEPPKGEGWTQDSDVLDTWFSSGMWTFSTLGYPEKTDDLKTYHPTQVLETGYEILTLWVSRMIMMSLFAVNEIPFANVYLHGMILDDKGKKMSKSKGNGIDPLDMISKYGTDATRMSVIMGNTPGNDMRISEQKIADFRNFTNKLWNISRYVISSCHSEGVVATEESKKSANKILRFTQNDKMTIADQWIIKKLNDLIESVTKDIEEFKFSQAGESLRDFTWNDFADWYVEVSKFEKTKDKDAILMYVLENLLKLWHPFMPFVTEAIWKEMENNKLLMISKWPTFAKATAGKPTNTRGATAGKPRSEQNNFELIKNIITTIRNIRSEYKIAPKEKIKAIIYAGDKVKLVESQKQLIEGLRTGVEVKIESNGDVIPKSAYAIVDGIEFYIPLEGLVDVKQETTRLQKRVTELKKVADNLTKKLDNQEFVRNAPKEVVEVEIAKLDGYKIEMKKLKEQVKHLK